MLNAGNCITLLGYMTACMNENVREYLSECYGNTDTEQSCITRQNLWETRVGKKGKSMSPLVANHGSILCKCETGSHA
ncbi:hypothetical protein DPMN_132869 [Dreissena polymorpha]|uniref:Uncharacterized protein n=1 Tax=Dreissena polymorpha TaxID=45954 RepID=A0A9D4FU66_DREPO|nr:hypothetical protein DPMN_132869 [Dreissena polymorpha]